MESDNPYNNEYVVLPATFDETKEGRGKTDNYVINKDIVRMIKMRYTIHPGWANEYIDTIEDYMDDLNMTVHVRAMLGWTGEEP